MLTVRGSSSHIWDSIVQKFLYSSIKKNTVAFDDVLRTMLASGSTMMKKICSLHSRNFPSSKKDGKVYSQAQYSVMS